MTSTRPHLTRALGLYAATAIVVGNVVGSGIFSSPSGMARILESAPLMLFVWILGGVFTAMGAMTQCELVAQMPRTGGMFVYLREIYGERTGFLYGWSNLMIAGSGAIAGIASIFASYFGEFVTLPKLSADWEQFAINVPILGQLYPFADIGVKLVGTVVIVLLTWINILGVKVGGRLQSVSTTAKILAIAIIVLAAFLFGGDVGNTSNWSSSTLAEESMSPWTLIGAIALALSGAFWAYDGWGSVAQLAGEVKDPGRTLPRAILLGAFTFISLYLVTNLAYLYILPIGEVGTAANDRVASLMASEVFGPTGGILIALLIMLSTFDTINSTTLTNARCYYAMAQEKIFWRAIGEVHPRYFTPHRSLILQCFWALVLLYSGSFWTIIDMYVFVNWLIYGMMGLGVFILRRRRPHAERPFKVPGYPWVPALFVGFAFTFVIVSLITDIQSFNAGKQPFLNSVMGLVLVFSGLPLYYLWKYQSRSDADDTTVEVSNAR